MGIALCHRRVAALKQIIPKVSKLMLFDYDSSDDAFHPEQDNSGLAEWKRQNIENYLLVPDAWKRAAARLSGYSEDELFAQPILQVIDEFFAAENLTLPRGKTWRNVGANVFSVVDGKRILFVNDNSLFQILRNGDGPPVPLTWSPLIGPPSMACTKGLESPDLGAITL